MLGWEDAFKRTVQGLRSKENSLLNKLNFDTVHFEGTLALFRVLLPSGGHRRINVLGGRTDQRKDV